MSFFKRLFGKKASSTSSQSNKSSSQQEAIPFDEKTFFDPKTESIDGNFLVHSFISEIPTQIPSKTLRCKSFLTEGMHKVGQEELILTIALPDNKNEYQYLTLPYVGALFRTIFHYASQGVTVSEGEYTSMGPKSNILGFKGVVYSQNPEKASDQVPDNCLSMILLREREIQVVIQMGYMRILTMIGKENLRYPFPLWNDLKRPEVRLMDDMLSKSLLAKSIPILPSTKSHVFQGKGRKLFIHLPKSMEVDKKQLKEEVLASKAFVITPGFDLKAILCKTWSENPNISDVLNGSKTDTLPEPFQLLGCMLVFLVDQEETKVFSYEDGFCVCMNENMWNEFSKAFLQKKDIAFDMGEDSSGDLTGVQIIWQDK